MPRYNDTPPPGCHFEPFCDGSDASSGYWAENEPSAEEQLRRDNAWPRKAAAEGRCVTCAFLIAECKCPKEQKPVAVVTMPCNANPSPQATVAMPPKRRSRRTASVLLVLCMLPVFVALAFGGGYIAEQISEDYYSYGAGLGIGCAGIIGLLIRNRYFPEVLPPKQ